MYHIIAFITILSFVIFGKNYRDKERFNYWKYAIIPILIFSLGFGLREGWGADYDHYKEIFLRNLDTELGLSLLNSFVRSLDLSYPGAFTLYSLILSVGIFSIAKQYKEAAMYILPLFWVTTIGAVGLIRFYVAVGWMLIAVFSFLNKNYKTAVLFTFISVVTHSLMFVVVPVLLILFYKDFFTRRWPTLIVFLVATILLDKEILGTKLITPFVEYLSNYISNERFNMYADRTDLWFSGERSLAISQNEGFVIIHRIRGAITNFLILYLGFECKEKYKNGSFYYGATCVGLIFANSVMGFELVERFVSFFQVFEAVIVGLIMHNYFEDKAYNKFFFWTSIIFILVNMFFRPLFGTETLLRFNTYIWD